MNYIIYQLKVACILLGFYIIYVLFLKRSSLFAYRRFFLLGGLMLSFIIPFINIAINSPQLYQYYQLLPEVTVGNGVQAAGYNFQGSIYILLSLITLFFLWNFIKRLYNIFALINSSTVYRRDGYKIVHTEGNIAFSFINYIFLGRKITGKDADVILAHEKVHSYLLHSIDILIVEFILLMQWFNPFLWLIRKEMKENHEFEADRLLLENGISSDQYQQLLLNQMFQTSGVRFSSFNYNSFIKNRIKMMTIHTHAGKTRFLLASVLSLFVVLMFSFKAEIVNTVSTSAVVGDTVKKKAPQDVPYLTPEKPATFNGGDINEFNTYVVQNIKYPQDAVKEKITGKVYVQFVIDIDGSVKDAKVLRGVAPLLDEEAVRVVKSSPKWTPATDKGKPVKQICTLPVVFSLK